VHGIYVVFDYWATDSFKQVKLNMYTVSRGFVKIIKRAIVFFSVVGDLKGNVYDIILLRS